MKKKINFLVKIVCIMTFLIVSFNIIFSSETGTEIKAAEAQFVLPPIPKPKYEVIYSEATTATVTTATDFVSAYLSATMERIVLANDIVISNAQVNQLYGTQRTRSIQIDGQGHKLSFSNYLSSGIFQLNAGVRGATFHLKDLKMEKTLGDAENRMWFRIGGNEWNIIFENVTNDTGVRWFNVGYTGGEMNIFFRGANGPFLVQEDMWRGSGNVIFEENSIFNSPYPPGNGTSSYFRDTTSTLTERTVSFGKNSQVYIEGSNGNSIFLNYENFNSYSGSSVLLKKAGDNNGVINGIGTTKQNFKVDAHAKLRFENKNGRAYSDGGAVATILGNPGSDVQLIGNYTEATTEFKNIDSTLILNSPAYFDLRNDNLVSEALFSLNNEISPEASAAFQIIDSNIGAWIKGVPLTNIPTAPSPFNNVSLITNSGPLLGNSSVELNTMPSGWQTSDYPRIAYFERPVITATDKTVGLEKVISIDATYTPIDAIVSYASSNSEIASIDTNGMITGVGVGTTTIRMSATSAEGVLSYRDINVTVTNDTPILTVAPLFMELPLNASFSPMYGVSSTDTEDGDLTSNVVVTGTVNTSVEGVYPVDYSITDSNNNTLKVRRVVLVNDNKYIVGTNYIIGAIDFTKRIGQVDTSDAAIISAANAKAYKITDGTPGTITVINTNGYNSVVGKYDIEFGINEEPGTTSSIVASVVTGVNPVLTVEPEVIVANVGDVVDPMVGVSATDVEDSSLTITHNGPVNTTAEGIQIITYSVTDSDNNTVTATRSYIVQSASNPVIVGTDYAIFAEAFTKRIGQVDTSDAAIISAANARAFNLSTGTATTVELVETGGYEALVGEYTITFAVAKEPELQVAIVAKVVKDPDLSAINVKNREIIYEKGEVKSEIDLLTDAIEKGSNLPATGEKTQLLYLIGVFIIALSAIILLLLRKVKKQMYNNSR
ncbi:immunoglobulin-like domain-containing protein [Carnobacterium maltaromaticum]|uniref:immunoglobulin-like domain-containing protein n=1 Tax=Carnobacterium maltaromaticum TaxID=2751 RepID=UPI0012FB42DA|nr:immunoglobulin-like domain-containing protein [Carnobacterium maltaromaticum]